MFIQIFMLFAMLQTPDTKDSLFIDFGNSKQGEDWYVIVDGVMGGLSSGNKTLLEDAIKFTGTVSLENNGGFSSLRGPYSEYDLSLYDTLEIRIKGVGQQIALTFDKEEAWFMPKFKYSLAIEEDWTTIKVSLADFEAHRIGRPMGIMMDAEARRKIIRLGFITDSKKASDFSFEIDYLKFY